MSGISVKAEDDGIGLVLVVESLVGTSELLVGSRLDGNRGVWHSG
jgi:hypothetical protein